MPTLSFTVSTAASNEITDAFAVDYQPVIDGELNPESKQQFARRQIIAFLKLHVVQHRRNVAAVAAAGTDPDIT